MLLRRYKCTHVWKIEFVRVNHVHSRREISRSKCPECFYLVNYFNSAELQSFIWDDKLYRAMLIADMFTSYLSIFDEACRSNNKIEHPQGSLSWNIAPSRITFHYKFYNIKWRRRDCFYLKQWQNWLDGNTTFAIRKKIYLKYLLVRLLLKIIYSNNFAPSNQWPSCFCFWSP